ncbi:putative F-box/LRR-repeat protein 23 [Arachis duranensis]|uniref:F-box/LRR-repeat protein 23 n=1 Tax=Arachis duranensis TaxID=130453 RepID=A0A6P5MT17_ARADU|nr:putative F-box/LRR-repeat protein 23 [Arachis duranensis]
MDHRSINAGPAKQLNWLDLPNDLTLMIIEKLTTFQILTSVQFVCRKWWRICMDPLMWRTINMCNIGIRNSVDYKLEKMCRHAIDRSCGQLVDISIEYFGTDDLLKYIIDSGCHKLQRLRLVQCFHGISDKGLCEMAEKLPLLEELDITLCLEVSSIALEAIGRRCPLLKSFKYNNNAGGNKEAFVIAQNMSNLRHLQLFKNYLDNSGLSAILDGCPHLESLDLRLCCHVKLEGKLRTRCDEQLKDLRDPDAPCDDFQFWGLCFETAYDDEVFDYENEKRAQKQEAQKRETRRINSGSSTGKKNNVKSKSKKKR